MNKSEIHEWLEKFKSSWLLKDIDSIFNLFTDDVQYWETPFRKLGKGTELHKVWNQVLPLEDMQFTYEIFSAEDSERKYVVKWNFKHSVEECSRHISY